MGYRYLGNKSRLTDWLLGVISDIVPKGARLLDPMCGTGSVSSALAQFGYAVTASDELGFPVLHAKARLLHSAPYSFNPVARDYEDAIRRLNGLQPTRDYFWREYSDEGEPTNGCKPRKYFTGANAAKIDAIRAQILAWRKSGLMQDAADLLLHDLIMAVNDVANIAGTYGYYRSTWNSASLIPLVLTMSPQVKAGPHRVQQGRLEDIADGLVGDACYLDPPYTKRQYGGNYHILETLAQEDIPEPVGEGGLRDWYPKSSDFCSKRRVRLAMHESIKRLKVATIFLSYSEDGLIGPEEMVEILSLYGELDRRHLPIGRFRSNGRVKAGDVHEHLYVLRRT